MGKYAEFINATNIRVELARHDFTYADMAPVIGRKSKTSFTQFIRGEMCPNISQMVELAKKLKQPVTYFFNIPALNELPVDEILENNTAESNLIGT